MDSFFYPAVLSLTRIALPLISLLLALIWGLAFWRKRPQKQTLARLVTRLGEEYALTAAEGLIGRKKGCDLCIGKPSIHKEHALFEQKEGAWWLTPLKGQVYHNEKPMKKSAPLHHGDVIALGEEEFIFECDLPQGDNLSSRTPRGGGGLLLVLSLFQGGMGLQLCARFWEELPPLLPPGFALMILGEWIYFLLTRKKGDGLLWEIPVWYLVTLGFSVCACAAPSDLPKQLLCMALGITGSTVLTCLLKYPYLCYNLRIPIGIGCVGILWATVAFGTRIYGSTNWLTVGGFSFQPMEFAKIGFLTVGSCLTATVYLKPLNRWYFIAVSALMMMALVCMVDFGAIAIFFVTLLILLSLRQTNRLLVAGMGAGAIAAGALVLTLFPHVASRFSAWLHVWEYADSVGYQQTRTLISMASGGLLGVGGGNGTLLSVSAADTDLVFGVICEEWGQLIGLCALLCVIALALTALRFAKTAPTAFHAMGVCGAAGMMVFQTALNVFGSTDLLPLTGVTFMFVSRGGTSLIAAFLLTAFFQAAKNTPCPIDAKGGRNQ